MTTPISVLYLEDSASDADLACRALAKYAPHITLDLSTTVADALTKLGTGKHYDLLLADLALPDGSGLDILAMVRENKLRTAVVILTGSGHQSAVIAALKAGADDYIVKRDDYLQHLPRTLDTALLRYRETAQRRGQTLHVLYVEHNSFDIDLLRRHLTTFAPHIRLTIVHDASDALRLLSTRQFDVVLADYLLPGTDGLELARILKRENPSTATLPFVLLTGQGSEEVAAAALHLGVDDYLNKHEGYLYEISAILEKVHRDAQYVRQRLELQTTAERLTQLIEAAPCILYELTSGDDGLARTSWVSDNILRMTGYTVEQTLAPGWWYQGLHPDDRDQALNAFDLALKNGYLLHEYRFKRADGRWMWIRDEQRLTSAGRGKPFVLTGIWLDITAQKNESAITEARNQLLDQLLERKPMSDILGTLARQLETLVPKSMASVLLIDPVSGLFQTAAAPSLPEFYIEAVNQVAPLSGNGSCGTAAATGEITIATNIELNANWQQYQTITQKAGLRSCWSVPFTDNKNKVLGTIAIYKDETGEPGQEELSWLIDFSRLAALAVSKCRDQDELDRAAAVFGATRDGIIITDTTPAILAVNRAFTEVTGYPAKEAIGQNPSMLQSGRHKRDFYQAMWRYIGKTGHWQGEVWNRRKNGEVYPQWLTISTIYDEAGEPINYVAVFTDISNIKASEAQLEHLAHYDPLTDLPNRLLARSRLQEAVEMSKRRQSGVAVLFIDLDHFKNINDSLGHPAGDELLMAVSQRLLSRLRSEDTLARLGGDEFLVILNSLESAQQAASVAQSLLDQMNQPFLLGINNEVFAGLSIGISLIPDDASDADELVQHADAAMYLAKQQGRNTYRFHTEALTLESAEKLSLQTQLRFALERDELTLHYQPLVNATSGKAIGVEVLARWYPPGNEPIPPSRFIPIAEDSGLIMALGDWVLHTACKQAKQWLDQGVDLGTFAVNVSGRQFSHARLADRVRNALQVSGLPADHLELELTESMLMQHPDRAIETLKELKALGVRISIDDFGTGYSSLAYLKRFPIDTLKIDKSFVDGLPDQQTDREITATIVAIAKTLHLSLVAEGIETLAQRDCLASMGCNIYQGYLFSRPLAPDDFVKWYKKQC